MLQIHFALANLSYLDIWQHQILEPLLDHDFHQWPLCNPIHTNNYVNDDDNTGSYPMKHFCCPFIDYLKVLLRIDIVKDIQINVVYD